MTVALAERPNNNKCLHSEDADYFRDGICKGCGFVCDHPTELHENYDNRQTEEVWGAPQSWGSKGVECLQCGEDVTELYSDDDRGDDDYDRMGDR